MDRVARLPMAGNDTRMKTDFDFKSAREKASRARWATLTDEQKRVATQPARAGRIAGAARRRLRKALVGEDKRISGDLLASVPAREDLKI